MMGKMFSVVTPILPFCIVLIFYYVDLFVTNYDGILTKKMPDEFRLTFCLFL